MKSFVHQLFIIAWAYAQPLPGEPGRHDQGGPGHHGPITRDADILVPHISMPEDVCDGDSDCTDHEYEDSGVCAWESHAEVNRICCSSHSIVRGSSIVGKLMPSKFCNDHVPIGGECGVSEQCQEYKNRSYCAKGICQQKQSEGLACNDSMACMNECKFSWCIFKICFQGFCT